MQTRIKKQTPYASEVWKDDGTGRDFFWNKLE